MSPPDSPDVAAERRQRGTPEELDTVGVHAAMTLGALVLRGRKADDATAGSRAMARIFAMSAADRAGLSLVDDMAVDLLEKDADAGSLMGLPWALSAVRAGAGELAVEQWRDVGELVARTGETVQAFLEAKGLADGWVGSLLDESARPLQTEELDADMRAMLAIDGDVRGLLVFDALLAGLLDKLGQRTWATKVRATTTEERGERWRLGAVRGAGETVFQAVWAGILDERERAAKEAEAREERVRKVPVPSMSGLMAAAVAGLGRQGETPTLRGQAAGIVAYEPGAWVRLAEADGDTAGVLAAWLARVAHRQWLEGVGQPDRVEVVASRESLKKMGLGGDTSRSPAEVLEAALALLASVRLMGNDGDKQKGTGHLVLDVLRADKRAPSEKGGRPSSVYVVSLGWPLIPTQLEALAAERGFTIPRELVWYGPVLEPAWAPLTGNTRTQRTQCLAYSVGAGQWLVSRREEYAELGGVRLDTLRPFLQSMGLYHRSHASLADDVAAQWRTAPPQPKLPGFGPKGPLLVPTKVDGVYRLGPDYKAQEALVIRNADVTAKAKAKQRRGKAKP